MYQVLLCVKKPESGSYQDDQRWRGCAANLSHRASKNKNIQLLGENVLLIQLDQNLDALAEIIPDTLGLAYSYTILPSDTKWIEVPAKV